MLIIILIVLACLSYVIHDIVTKPTLQRDVVGVDELGKRRLPENKARMAA